MQLIYKILIVVALLILAYLLVPKQMCPRCKG